MHNLVNLNLHLYIFSDPPRVRLQLGANIDPAFVFDGNDVFFECKIEANPKIYKVEWYKDVSISLFGKEMGGGYTIF